MVGIQESRRTEAPTRPHSSRYYATGAVVHLALSGGLWATGYGWSAVPLLAAAILTVLAVLASRRKIGQERDTRRPQRGPTVLHFDSKPPAR